MHLLCIKYLIVEAIAVCLEFCMFNLFPKEESNGARHIYLLSFKMMCHMNLCPGSNSN